MLQHRRWRYAVFVLVPSLMVWAYLEFIATPGFVSRVSVMVEEESTLSVPDLPLSGLLGMGTGSSLQDALVVKRFMQSRTMLAHLDQTLKLREHLSSLAIDPVARLTTNASLEEFLEHYLQHLKISIDEEAVVMTVEFVAYDPDYSHQVTSELVSRSEQFVNSVSHSLARRQLAFIEQEVKSANTRLKQAAADMIILQRQYDMFSPELESQAVGQIIAGLEAELAKQRTALKAMQSYLNDSASDVVAALSRIEALESQLSLERARLVGGHQKDDGLNDVLLRYQDAQVSVKLAAQVYQTALASLEKTRVDASRQVKYLVSVDQPSIPDAAEMPNVAYWSTTFFVLFNLLYFVLGLILATIQDHRE